MRWEVGPSPGKQVADVEGGENEQFNGQLEEVQREKKKKQQTKTRKPLTYATTKGNAEFGREKKAKIL